jgi:capsular exopolysaccharide synthesis family protein
MAQPVSETFEEKNINPLNIKRVLGRIIRHWYVVVLSLLVGLSIAFLINRYSDRVYPSHISILIKESEEATGSAELLYNNPLIDPYRNFYNEVYIIKSIPLIQDVVENLNFMISYHREGQIKISESYKAFPFTTILLSDTASVRDKTYQFKIVSNERFVISKEDKILVNGIFNDSIDVSGVRLYFKKGDSSDLGNYINDEYILKINNSVDLASSFASRLKIEWAEEGSSVVNISLTGEVPEKNNDFLNELAQVYNRTDLEKKVQTATRSINFIEDQLREIEDSLKIYETKLETFKAQNYTTELDARSLSLIQRLEELENDRGELRLYENYFDYLKNYIQDPDNKLDQVVLPSMIGVNDAVINNLLLKLVEIQNKIRRLPEQVESNNPLVKTAYSNLTEVKNQILESLKNLEATQQITLNKLSSQIKAIESQLNELPSLQRTFITINRNYKFSEKLFDFLIQKRAEAGISKASSTSDILVVNPASSGGVIYPNVNKNYIIAAIGGLGIPIIIFILLELLNRRIQSQEDIEKITNIPFIGSIGHAPMDSNLMVYNKPKSAMAEAFRALRSNLNYFAENKDKRIFLITSSISGEGKTFTTINLATVFAFSEKKILIIGADMRRPRIFGDFNLRNDIGLSTYLSDQSGLEDSIQETFIKNLYLLSAGPVPPNPSELLLRKKFTAMFELLREKFDYILIDSPPLALITDALIIANIADHVIYITRQNVTPKETLFNIDEHYHTGKIKNVSLLFNDIKKTGIGYGYGKGYGYYYGYGYGYKDGYYED